MGKKFLLLVTVFLLTLPTAQSLASERKMFELDREGSITARVINAPLSDALKDFCDTFNLDIKGRPAGDESVSLSVTGGTFDDTLNRLMRGYNYVLIQEAESHRPTLILLGKAERSKYVEQAPVASVVTSSPAYVPAATPTGQQGLSSAPFYAALPEQGDPLPSGAQTERPRTQLDGEKARPQVSSAGPAQHPQSQAGSATPPMPPDLAGLEPPPMPPALPQAPGEIRPSPDVIVTPPPDPKPKPKPDIRDLTPPPIPF